MHTRVGALLIAIALPIVASACGDDSSTSDTLPSMITTTTTTTIPATTTTAVSLYTVKPGDSLSEIAKQFGVDQAALMMVNGISDPDHIEAGSVLTIPPPTTVAATDPATSTAPSTT
ncbi:MAG: LysM peptidoglycan-binding domain-containing protein [Ilumatobacteraceae bacterium]